MKTLVIDTTINAHTESFSAQLLQQIKQQFAESTTYLPLNDMDLPTLDEATLTVIYKQKAGEALSVAEQAIADTRQSMLQQFKAHQKIVIIYPMYNYNIPARLKDYMDMVLVPRETFQYSEAGKKIGRAHV